jgi:uncharacterized protein (DUF488 family)
MKEFLHVLRAYQIEVIVDVRRFPTSRYRHFKQEPFKECLEQHGIEYYHVGRLGGYRNGGYRKYMKTADFEDGLQRVEELAASKRVALMCAELLFSHCHRRFIADALKERGHTVIHILDDKKSCEHKGKGDKDVDMKLDEFLDGDTAE